MAERPIWRGHLRLALVSCPVALHSASHDSSNLHFHFINPDTGNRVKMITQDAGTGAELRRGDLARGFEFRKGEYLIMSDEDFESVRLDSSSTLTVDKFVPHEAIDPVYFDSSYYMVPDGQSGADVYVVLREAIAASGKIALSRVVIARRERAVAIMPMGRGLVVHTLHEAKDLHSPATLFGAVPDMKPDPEMVQLARQLVDRQTREFDPSDMDDRYEARLREVIEAKVRGEGRAEPAPEPQDRGNVIDLMAALKRSLASEKSAPKKPAAPAEAATPKKAPAKKAPVKKTPALSKTRKRA